MLCSCLVVEGEHKPNKRVYSLNAVAERDREGGRREGGTGTKAVGERDNGMNHTAACVTYIGVRCTAQSRTVTTVCKSPA